MREDPADAHAATEGAAVQHTDDCARGIEWKITDHPITGACEIAGKVMW